MTIQAVIYDLGGVLVRTEDYTPRENLANRLGLTRLELETLVFSSESSRHCQLGQLEEVIHWRNVGQTLGLAPEQVDEFKAEFFGGDRLDLDLIKSIRCLRPTYQTALLSNHFPSLRYGLEQGWQISDAFDLVTISCEVGLVKPDPRIYQLTLDRLRVVPARAVFIDDFIENIAGAQAAGLHTIHFQSAPQAQAELLAYLT